MKKIISLLVVFATCIQMFPSTVLAKNSEAFELYQRAVNATIGSGSWTEALSMTGDMKISKDKSKIKTKVTLESVMDIDNYLEEDVSKIQMSGNVSMNVMNQTYAWNVQYENGIAHYEYTEPTQQTADIEMDPSYFNLDLLTADMMENAKASNNKITYTISGDKMEEAGITVVKLMPGIDDLRYGNVDVKVLLNESTGAIDTIEMKFKASLTYQGYDADVDYTVNYQFINKSVDSIEENQNEYQEQSEIISDGLVIYSDYTNLSIRKDNVITLCAGIMSNGELEEDVSGITFWIEDSSILRCESTGIKNNCRYVKLKGISDGITRIGFSDSNTGYSVKVPITVYTDNYLSYTLSSVPVQYIDKYPTNIYNANGLYIDNYKFEIEGNQSATVSFDVYNTSYTYGAVEVFDAEGELKNAVLIDKMRSSNTSIKEAVWDNTGYLIRDLFDGDFLTYRQETGYSKHTSVSVQIPKNGYIKISNDPEGSFIVNLVNSSDILISMGFLMNKIKNFDVNSPKFAEKLTLKMVQEKAYAEFVKDGSDMQKKLWKNVGKDVFVSSEALENFSDTISKNISELKLENIIIETASEIGIGVSEKIFEYFSGPIGKTLSGLFSLGKIGNIVVQYNNLVNSAGVGSIYIQNQGGGTRSCQQITVESENDFSDNTSLNVFEIKLDSVILDLIKNANPDLYESIQEGTTYTYDISLLDKGEQIQPDGEITVYIPIPDELKLFAYIGKTQIYRIGEDGEATEMDVSIENGSFVFKTDHFSIYTITAPAKARALKFAILIGIVITICIIILLTVRNIIKRKKRRG